MFIKEVFPRIIRDSREDKTIEFVVRTLRGKFVASAPYGKSRGKYERPAFNKMGVSWSLKLASNFCSRLRGKSITMSNFEEFSNFENEIKRFESESGELGANTTYALETAMLKAAAKEREIELWEFVLEWWNKTKGGIRMPKLVGNCVGGGMHSRGIRGKKPDFQEFLLIPQEEKGRRAVTKNIHAYYSIGRRIKKEEKILFGKRNDEGAWETSLSNEKVLRLIREVAVRENLRLGVDVAASTFFDNRGEYEYKNKEMVRSKKEQIEFIELLAKNFDLAYIEDPIDEEDFTGFSEILSKRKNSLIVGDDLTATNLKRTEEAVRKKSINAMIIKPNQNGYLGEVLRVVEFCKKNNVKIVVSHRSGETMDDALADFAVGFQANFMKSGIYGKERLIKLKRLIDIEKSLGF